MEITMSEKLKDFGDYIVGNTSNAESEGVVHWLNNTATANEDINKQRDWCTLDLTGLTAKDLAVYFDRSKINDKYKEEFDKKSKAGNPFAFLQRDSDLIYSMHRCFVTRHRGRLMSYRDDSTQKKYHTLYALSLANVKYATMKTAAEKTANRVFNNSLTTT